MMSIKIAAAAIIASVGIAFAVVPANAVTKKRPDATYTRVVNEDGRPRTRIVVQRRSFLDPGTETLPLAQHYHDYAFSPYLAPRQPYPDQGGVVGFWRAPLPSPVDLPGFYFGR